MLTSLVLALLLAEPLDLTPPCPPSEGELRITLGLGHQKVLAVKGYRGHAVSGVNLELVKVRSMGESQLLVIGEKKGLARFTVFGDEGAREVSVLVQGWGCDLCLRELPKLFPCGTRLTERLEGDRLILEGVAATIEAWQAVRKVKAAYPNVALWVQLAPRFVDRAVHDANLALHRAGFDQTRVVVVGEQALLEGEVPAGSEARVRALATPWLVWLESLLSPGAPEPTSAPPGTEGEPMYGFPAAAPTARDAGRPPESDGGLPGR